MQAGGLADGVRNRRAGRVGGGDGRRDEQDAAVGVGRQRRRRGLEQEQVRLDVDGVAAVPVGAAERVQLRERRDARPALRRPSARARSRAAGGTHGVRDDDVEPAQRGNAVGNQPPALALDAHVAARRQRARPRGAGETHAWMATARTPCAAVICATSAPAAARALWKLTTTFAPSCAKRAAVTAPSPREPPVTKTFLLARS